MNQVIFLESNLSCNIVILVLSSIALVCATVIWIFVCLFKKQKSLVKIKVKADNKNNDATRQHEKDIFEKKLLLIEKEHNYKIVEMEKTMLLNNQSSDKASS